MDVEVLEVLQNMRGEGAYVINAEFGRDTAGNGANRTRGLGGQIVEQYLGEAAPVVIAGA